MKKWTAIVPVVTILALTGAVFASGENSEGTEAADMAEISIEDADLVAAEELFQKTCRNCHGPKAQGVASYPKLTDKTVEHIVMRLEQYRDREKVGPNSMLMFAHAKDLSDADMVNIAAYVTTAFTEE